MRTLVGQTLGPYRIVARLGRGGMAAVYKAYQPALDRYVALKVLPAHLVDEPGFADRFKREARAVARLEHPHILQVYDYGQEGDLSYIAMRYVEGGTLKALLGKPLDLAKIVDLIGQIGEALDYAHEHGVIHRDVKPSNVLLDERKWVLLTDFGVARMVEATQQLTATGVGVGTPAYMSPEQGQGKKVDGRSDIYSLGVMLYEMLTGRVPFEAETPLAMVWKHVNEPLPLPRSINPEVPEAIERLVLKAMAKDPDDRYAQAGDMAQALREVQSWPLIASTTPPGRETAARERIPPWRQNLRRMLSWALPIVATIGMVALLLPRLPLRVQIAGGRVEIVSSEHAQQAIEPTKEPTSTPTAGPTEGASELDAGGERPIVAATYTPNAPLFDDFEAEGGFDDAKWAISSSSSEGCLISKSDGVAVFRNDRSAYALACILSLVERGPVAFGHLGFLEAGFYAVGDATGAPGNQMINFFTPELEGGEWFAQCGLGWDSSGKVSAVSQVANLGRDGIAERTRSIPALVQKWYRFRLEVNPATEQFSCYVDDRLIDSYVPGDIAQLRHAQFYESISDYREPGGSGTAWSDNVRISELLPKTSAELETTRIPTSPVSTIVPSNVNLFEEDFETGMSSSFVPLSGHWEVVDDGTGKNMVLETSGGQWNKWSHVEFGPAAFTDGTIEYRVRLMDYNPSYEEGGTTSLQFRAAQWGDSTYSLVLSPYYRSLILAYEGPYPSNEWDSLGELRMTIERQMWYSIRLEIKSGSMTVFLDDTRVIVGNYTRLAPNGRLAFNVDIGARVQFDDIRVVELPSTSGSD